MRTCGQCSVAYPDAVEFCPRDGQKLPPPPEPRTLVDPLIGSTIDGRYLVESVLGQGGMGTVYAGRHAIIDKRVAIKVLRQDQADESSVQRFLVEAKAASKIGHQNIVDITDFGVLPGGQTYFVMEFLDGPTLGRIVHEKGHLEPRRAIAIAVQIARGLQAAHDKEIIHRDLKPENIFVLVRDGQFDVVKIVDFGIAKDKTHKKKLTQVGMVLGTPEYMSPEQATGQATDHRVDMYALGCILYEMLTGDVPFRAETATKTLTQHVFDQVVPPSKRRPELNIPPPLEAVVMRMLQKKAADRFTDLREVMEHLERVDRELRPSPRTQRAAVSTAPMEPVAPATTKTAPPSAALEIPRTISRKVALFVGGFAVVVVVFGLALLLGRKKGNEVATPAPTPATTPTPPQQPVPDEVEIVVRTRPSGAEIYDDGVRLGFSPHTFRRPRGETPIVLTVHMGGYKEETLRVLPTANKDIEIQLEPKRKAVARTAPPVPSPPPVPVTSPPPNKPRPRVSDLRNPFE